MTGVCLTTRTQRGMRAKRVARHAYRISTCKAPGFINRLAPGDFIQRKHHILQSRQKLVSTAQRTQCSPVTKAAGHTAHRVNVAARMLQMQHHKASIDPSLPPNITPLTRAAQAMRVNHHRPAVKRRSAFRPADAHRHSALAAGILPGFVCVDWGLRKHQRRGDKPESGCQRMAAIGVGMNVLHQRILRRLCKDDVKLR